MTRRSRRATAAVLGAALAAALAVAPDPVQAAGEAGPGYPTRAITVIVPMSAGGPIDTTTRVLTEAMSRHLGRPVVIENVGGAAGSIAAGRVARAAPDGYTLGIGIWGTHVANAAIYPLQYDVQKDFVPIGLVSVNTLIIVSRKGIPARDMKELIAWLRDRPDRITQGTSGVGSVGHVAGLLFQKMTGTRYPFAPYRGLALAMQDLLAGNIDLIFDTPATSLPQLRAGTIRAYAVTAKSRLAAAPDIPTVDEAGVPGLYAFTWTALFAPAGTPKEAIAVLNDAQRKSLAEPAVRARLAEVGQEVYPPEQQTPEALAAFQKAEIEKWWPVIRAARITGE